MTLTGRSFIGSRRGAAGGAPIHGMNPASGQQLDPMYSSASPAEVEEAVNLAAQAFPVYAATSGKATPRVGTSWQQPAQRSASGALPWRSASGSSLPTNRAR